MLDSESRIGCGGRVERGDAKNNVLGSGGADRTVGGASLAEVLVEGDGGVMMPVVGAIGIAELRKARTCGDRVLIAIGVRSSSTSMNSTIDIA